MKRFNLKNIVKQLDIFREPVLLLCFLKVIIPLKKTCMIVCSEISYCENSYHVKTSQLITLQINWPISISYNFLLNGVSRQTLIIATLIQIYRMHIYFFKIYVTGTNKKEKYQNTNLLTRAFTMRYFFSVIISQKTYTAKMSHCQNSDIREVSIALV